MVMKEVILLARRARKGDYMQVDEERSVDWGCVSIPKVTIAGPIRQREWRGGCSTSDGGAGHDAISGSCFRAVDAVQVTEGLVQSLEDILMLESMEKGVREKLLIFLLYIPMFRGGGDVRVRLRQAKDEVHRQALSDMDILVI